MLPYINYPGPQLEATTVNQHLLLQQIEMLTNIRIFSFLFIATFVVVNVVDGNKNIDVCSHCSTKYPTIGPCRWDYYHNICEDQKGYNCKFKEHRYFDCRPWECNYDRDCPTGRVCRWNILGYNYCVNLKCRSHSDCAQWMHCENGRCK